MEVFENIRFVYLLDHNLRKPLTPRNRYKKFFSKNVRPQLVEIMFMVDRTHFVFSGAINNHAFKLLFV